MNPLALGLRSFRRDLRAGELSILLAAVVVAVTAMTAVGFFTDRVGGAMKAQASEVLAADMVVRSPNPIDAAYLRQARMLGLEATETLSFPTVVLAGEASTLSAVDAAGEGYPLRGELKISDTLFGNAQSVQAIPPRGEAWAEPGLLGRLGIEVGTTVTLGELDLKVTRVLQYKPDQNVGFVNLAPGLLVNLADIPATGVVKTGSRVTYNQMYAGPEAMVGDFRGWLKPKLRKDELLRGREDASQQVSSAIDRAQRFLTLASLVTVILAAVAAAMAARRYALRHLDTVALMKTLGASQGLVIQTMLIQLLLVIVATAAVGLAAGYGAQYGLAVIARDFVGFELPPATGRPYLLGLLTAATVVVGFAMPHLLRLGTIPPIRVLRRDLPAPRLGTAATYGIALLALLVMVLAIVRDLLLVGLILAGVAVTALVAMGLGFGLVRVLGRFRGAAGVAWRYGLANIARRGSESVVQIVAFGLSLMVLLLLGLVRNDVLSAWERTIPPDSPNQFLINIEPEQLPGLQAFFRQELGNEAYALPLIRGRVTAIKGVPADQYRFPAPQGASFIQREANITWSGVVPDGNTVAAGSWWGETYSGAAQISMEEGLARDMGVQIGDTLTLNVGGEDVTAPVTSFRVVNWDSFRPNFFLVMSPGVVEDLPQTWLASLYVPRDRPDILTRLVRQFPGVTVLDLEIILAQIRTVIDRASMAIQYVFLFTLFAGVVVLLAAVQLTRDERRFESAILHTLGAGRRTILQGVAVEFITLGGLAGVLAALGATLAGFLLSVYAFDLDYRPNLLLWLVGLTVGAVVVGATGTLATRRAVQEPPVAVLRER